MLIYINCFYLYCRLDAICQEERRKRNRQYQRKRRQRIDSDPDSRRDNLEKEKQRWKNRVQNKKIIRTKGTEALQEVLEESSEKVKKVQSSAECKAGSRHPSRQSTRAEYGGANFQQTCSCKREAEKKSQEETFKGNKSVAQLENRYAHCTCAGNSLISRTVESKQRELYERKLNQKFTFVRF